MGALKGIRIIEMEGIGPAPFAGMMLADMGADVVVIQKKQRSPAHHFKNDSTQRGKRFIALDVKDEKDKNDLLSLIEKADILIEGYRPGVMERLGLGPDDLLQRNPRLIYGRMTGWGQHGPLAHTAGHDINYIATTGALHAIGRSKDKPIPPLNLVGDYGGGALFLVTGVLAALIERSTSNKGQVVDAAMTDGSALLMSLFYTLHSNKQWDQTRRGSNLLDSGAPFYEVYECSDKKYIAVGALEPQFYAVLEANIGENNLAGQYDLQKWSHNKEELTRIFLAKTRDEWWEIFKGTDACVSPVLDFIEAPNFEHHKQRQTYSNQNGHVQPSPAPKFSRTPSEIRDKEAVKNFQEILSAWQV